MIFLWIILINLHSDSISNHFIMLHIALQSSAMDKIKNDFKLTIDTPIPHLYRQVIGSSIVSTVETLYSMIYYSKYSIELNIGKSTQYVAL